MINPHELVFLHIIHVVSILLLTGFTFLAFVSPPETRKHILRISGIATLAVLLTGIRMWQGLYGFAPLGWIIVKLVCWLGFSTVAGLAYRRRDLTAVLMLAGVGLLAVAVTMVYAKPF